MFGEGLVKIIKQSIAESSWHFEAADADFEAALMLIFKYKITL